MISKSRSRTQSVRRHNRARAQLSPLLENACSPIAKTDPQLRPPSSLLTSNVPSSTAVVPGSGVGVVTPLPVPLIHSSVPHHLPPSNHQLNTPQLPSSVSFPPSSYLPAQIPSLPFAFPTPVHPPLSATTAAAAAAAQQYLHQQQTANFYMGVLPTGGAVTTVGPNPLFPIPISPLSPPNAAPFYAPPVHQQVHPVHPVAASMTNLQMARMPLYYGGTPQRQVYGGTTAGYPGGVAGMRDTSQKWGSSPLSTQIEKTGHIQSVPPWFIFEQNRPEGKVCKLFQRELCFSFSSVYIPFSCINIFCVQCILLQCE